MIGAVGQGRPHLVFQGGVRWGNGPVADPTLVFEVGSGEELSTDGRPSVGVNNPLMLFIEDPRKDQALPFTPPCFSRWGRGGEVGKNRTSAAVPTFRAPFRGAQGGVRQAPGSGGCLGGGSSNTKVGKSRC